ncbi:MAG TPA: hypothetical protein VEZ11_18955 [Thermoanaerobaculia bacterium]|nr:hypothetical protein [Thermoanaerobaculia bacterium]
MTVLLDDPPFAPRDDRRFLDEMIALTEHHLRGCEPYRRIWPRWRTAESVEDLPFLHVGVFKNVLFQTEGAVHQRTLRSSGTSGAGASRIVLDEASSALQSRSSLAILTDLAGPERVPLLVLDHPGSLRVRGEIGARVAAAMSLKPLATEMSFLLAEPDDPASMKWDVVMDVLAGHEHIRVYGFTSILWLAWGAAAIPDDVRSAMRGRRIDFVHSGGWKKLEEAKVTRDQLDNALLADLAETARVVDYYGLVEQIGVIYPLCSAGVRHVPRWADVLVRDPFTLSTLEDEPGMLQLMNVLPIGAPYHSVLTEDLGRTVGGACPCGRAGKRFELIGRVPKAETRGCANV